MVLHVYPGLHWVAGTWYMVPMYQCFTRTFYGSSVPQVYEHLPIIVRMQYNSPNIDDNNNDPKLLRRTTKTAGRAVTHAWSEDRRDPIYMYCSLVAGLASGTVSSIVCAPLDLVRTRLQVWGDVVGNLKNTSTSSRWFVLHMFRDIIQNEGIRGCFRGLTATLLTVPTFWGVYCEFTMLGERAV
jgi:hypothetical protein